MIKKIINSKTSRQTIFLFAAQLFGMAVGFISNMLLARQMGASDFGIYSLSLAIIIFVSIFFEFGYFASASKMLANNSDLNLEKRIIGTSIIIACLIAILFLVFMLLISLLIDIVFNDDIGHIIRISSIVSWSFILPFFMELVLKGSNHIEYLAGFNIFSKILFVIFLFILYFNDQLMPLNVLLSFSFSYIVFFTVYTYLLRPKFSDFLSTFTSIQSENKKYGIHMYIGRVIAVSTYNVDRLLIGYFMGSKDVGFYGLANSMATPIYSFSAAMSSSLFKKLANDSKISSSILKVNLIWVFFAFILANILGYIIIKFYLGDEYKDVILLLFLMSIAICFQALYQPYNAWISGRGFGRELRKINIKMAIVTILSSCFLVFFLGAIGACFASIISNMYSLFLYTKITKQDLNYNK